MEIQKRYLPFSTNALSRLNDNLLLSFLWVFTIPSQISVSEPKHQSMVHLIRVRVQFLGTLKLIRILLSYVIEQCRATSTC